MTSGVALNEKFASAALGLPGPPPPLYNPPPLPGPPKAKFEALPRAARGVWGFSNDSASHTWLLKFLATRKPHCRAQLKPIVYCGSMVMGRASLRLSTPFLVSVTRLHI